MSRRRATIRRRVVGQAVEAVDDAIEYLRRLEEAPVRPDPKNGPPGGVRD
jgi:hypothetical protein